MTSTKSSGLEDAFENTTQPRQAMFGPGSKQIISGGTFTIKQSLGLIEPGLSTLAQVIAHSATYDSAERYPQGMCHPGTREEILQEIITWINDPNPSTSVLWLYGPAGSGKSAIMQTIAEKLRQMYKDRYAGSFFFLKGDEKRGFVKYLFSTLAYQFAINVSGMRTLIDQAMAVDITLPSKSFSSQLHSLIVEPSLRLPSPPTHTPTIIIDGLDECETSKIQRDILSHIGDSLKLSKLPFRFLIASRPEFWIRDSFDRAPLLEITKRVNLSNSHKASHDIRRYLTDGFLKIYNENQDVMQGVSRPWPPYHILEYLVHNSSCQFIYAATVLKFVGNHSDFSDPVQQLEMISEPGPLRTEAFSDLDRLYMRILSLYPRREMLLRVLGGILVHANAKVIEELFDVPATEIRMVLRAVAALVNIKIPVEKDPAVIQNIGPHEPDISFSHLSFKDFLEDSSRSREFAVEPREVYNHVYDFYLNRLIIKSFDIAQDVTSDGMLDLSHETWSFFVQWINAQDTESFAIQFIMDLKAGIDHFRMSELRISFHHAYVLRCLNSAALSLQSIPVLSMDITYRDTLVHGLRDSIQGLISECLRNLPVRDFLQYPKSCKLVSKGFAGLSELIEDLFNGQIVAATKFIDEHQHFVRPHRETELSYDGTLYGRTTFRVVEGLSQYLLDEMKSGPLHFYFRNRCLNICQSMLTTRSHAYPTASEMDAVQCEERKDGTPALELDVDVDSAFLRYTLEFSDFRYDQDPMDFQKILAFIDVLHNIDWMALNSETCEILIEWINRQLNNENSALILSESLDARTKMLGCLSWTYKNHLLPLIFTRYFPGISKSDEEHLNYILSLPFQQLESLDPLESDDKIPPYGIYARYHGRFLSMLDDYTKGFQLTIIKMLAGSRYSLPDDMEKMLSTRIVESLLQDVAAQLYYVDGGYLLSLDALSTCSNFLFVHANRSLKVFGCLKTLHYLHTIIGSKLQVPSWFANDVVFYLKKHEFDEDGTLRMWLEDISFHQNPNHGRKRRRFDVY